MTEQTKPLENSHQVGGNHYIQSGIQPWEAMEAWMTKEEFRGFLKGNAIKYLARCNLKGGLQDLMKAQHYLEKLISLGDPKESLTECPLPDPVPAADPSWGKRWLLAYVDSQGGDLFWRFNDWADRNNPRWSRVPSEDRLVEI